MRNSLLHAGWAFAALACATIGRTDEARHLQVELPDLPTVGTAVFSVDSRSAFLRTHDESRATEAHPIALAKLGLKPGTLIKLDVVGDFSWSEGQMPEDATSMIGIFSSSATLLPADNLHRVTGALKAGPAVQTGRTLYGNYKTDIDEDFPVAATELRIPEGARYLFVCPPDIFYSDNIDRDANYLLRITVR